MDRKRSAGRGKLYWKSKKVKCELKRKQRKYITGVKVLPEGKK